MTPRSPCGSHGLGSSDFARHYSRNHGCFLFLRVLRWFTSPGSLGTPMYSAHRTQCSHRVGSPIRTSPDHRLLAPPRSFSQLATSFFACLRQGIHTHALSSLTIKLTPDTQKSLRSTDARMHSTPSGAKSCELVATRQIFSCQRPYFCFRTSRHDSTGASANLPRESQEAELDAAAAQRHAAEAKTIFLNLSGER
jgi:hypothetical protein